MWKRKVPSCQHGYAAPCNRLEHAFQFLSVPNLRVNLCPLLLSLPSQSYCNLWCFFWYTTQLCSQLSILGGVLLWAGRIGARSLSNCCTLHLRFAAGCLFE